MNDFFKNTVLNETWEINKQRVYSSKGLVVAQEIEAATIGAKMIEDGGNAIDGAIATALALAVTEPWMSGLGGGGFMVAYIAAENRIRVVDFGMISPIKLKTGDYMLTGGMAGDLFKWPAVAGDVNFHGPKSIAAPGAVAGYELCTNRFGRKDWSELIAPAVSLAERGHRITWWTTLNVAADASLLMRYATSKKIWFPDGFVPTVGLDGAPIYLKNVSLANTLNDLMHKGPREFYEGDLAKSIVADIQHAGGRLCHHDLTSYEARIVEPITCIRGDLCYHLPGGLTAGPTFIDALTNLPRFTETRPNANSRSLMADVLIEAYKNRLKKMGHAGDFGDRSCTTHISTADSDGNMVMMTTTLLSRFGSRLVLPQSGILMNNGINWFDPRPKRVNSIAAGVRPLSNMCPMIVTKDGVPSFGLGASGGRKIMPAVFQLASFMGDFGMDINEAISEPRIDIGDIDRIIYDDRLDAETVRALQTVAPSFPWRSGVFPSVYAVPSGIKRDLDGQLHGAAHIFSPLATGIAV